MSDCKITCLPEEVIAIILSYKVITIEDIINFRCVCKHFRYAAVTYNKFLEKKLFQRWPIAKRKYENLNKTKGGGNINFVTKGINSAIQLRNYLSQILFYDYYYNNRSNKNYFNSSINNILEFGNVIRFSGNINAYVKRLHKNILFLEPTDTFIDKLKYMFYIEEIKYMLTQSPRIDRNSIERYCNINMSHYTKLSLIANELDRYKEKPEREQLLEETCTFVVQLIQLRKVVCYANVSALLDTIAQEVLYYLREKHPNHSIFSTSHETFSYWKTNNIEDNYWDETESTQIMDTLQEYIFGILNFRPCSYSRKVDLKSLCIDYVLQSKYGQHIIVFTIFHSVARRLGLRCDVIVLLTKTSIFWKPKYVTDNLENARCLYMTQEKFPNCLRNYLSAYTLCRPLAIAITTREMSLIIRSFVGEFITEHEITALGLVQVKFNV